MRVSNDSQQCDPPLNPNPISLGGIFASTLAPQATVNAANALSKGKLQLPVYHPSGRRHAASVPSVSVFALAAQTRLLVCQILQVLSIRNVRTQHVKCCTYHFGT